MILAGLFRGLFDAGVVIGATSNRAPTRLYENGLQRDRFLPFIALLEERLDRLQLDSGRDYRRSRRIGPKAHPRPPHTAAPPPPGAALPPLTRRATAGRDNPTARNPGA